MTLCMNSVQIDDFNDHIVYSGPWQAFSDQKYGFNGTRHVATAPGLTANFKFNGSCIFVNGIVGTNGTFPMPPTTFILDGHFTQMNGSVTDGATFPGTRFAQFVLYIAITLSEGEHELIITNIGGNASAPLMLDGFIITPLQQTNSSSSSAAPSSTSSNTSSIVSSATFTSTSSSASVSPTNIAIASSSSSHSHTGAIVGGVVGGVGGFLVLALVGLLTLRCISQRRGGATSDIRPFAAWRGGPVLPTAASSQPQRAAAYGEKHPHPLAPRGPGPAPAAESGNAPAEANVPDVPGPSRFFRDSKARPPHYAP